jgi:hypothetical protein
MPFDEDCHRDGAELPVMLESLQLVELKNSVYPTSCSTVCKLRAMKRGTNFSHANKSTFDCLAVYAEKLCSLAPRDLRNESLKEQVVEKGFSISVVALKCLSAEPALARQTAETSNPLPIARALIGATFLISKRLLAQF